MSYLDEIGLGQLWQRVDDIFARLTEAVGSMSFNSGTGVLTLFSCAGGELDSEDLDTRYPTKDEAAASLELSGNTLYINDVNGNHNTPTGGVNLKTASGAAFSLGINGKTLYLKDASGNMIQNSSITLP